MFSLPKFSGLCFLLCVVCCTRALSFGKPSAKDFYYVDSEEKFKLAAEKKEQYVDKNLTASESKVYVDVVVMQDIDVRREKSKPVEIKRTKRQDQTRTKIDLLRWTSHEESYFVVKIVVDSQIQERTALRDPSRLWQGNIIPYELSSEYRQSELDVILKALEEFHNKTCLIFRPRENDVTYMSIAPATACSSVLGSKEGPNRVTISENCYEVGIIQHEIMHVFGFVHEQMRPDRDEYVQIMWDNISERYRKNFRKRTWDEVQVFGQPYDYNSLLHYSSYEFAMDKNRPSIIPLQEGVTLVHRDTFSDIDLIKINMLFGCIEAI